jgi:DUF1680 family protein
MLLKLRKLFCQKATAAVVVALLLYLNGVAQERLYDNAFPLSDVKLLEGPFKHAQELNLQVLLEYDTDRLIAPFRKEAGLPEKALLYPNWAGLDGHVGGHYLTALAIHYASTGNAECKKRMLYMIAELMACQEANGKNHPGWGIGYVGGVPNSAQIWSTLQQGDFAAYRAAWVPWYNVHKLYAGLRDAWLYTGNKDAREIFLKFCDWGIHITSALTDSQMEAMLDTEHGGMNEIFTDAYQMTGDEKYLTAAKLFSHRMLLDAMAAGNDNLDNKHANTQVPKAVGFQRIAELTHDEAYVKAGRFFWETVTGNRSLAFGGNSRREFFPSVASCPDFVEDVEGPETCNSYNMLKLTEDLFRVTPQARYADYYERTMFNHILSTQHPEHGGYVYFTPARPRHYRVYSAPNQAMWCCVGSGMENHGKYNQFIYTHRNDSLFVNLFVASELRWREKGVKMVQETRFPDEESTTLKVTGGKSKFTLMVRYPGWVKEGALKILVNGEPFVYDARPASYVGIKRTWKKGDRVEIHLPMHTSVEPMPNVPRYIALMHGPILLGAKTGSEDLKGLVADDGRWSHIAGGQRLPVDQAPIIIENSREEIAGKLIPVPGKPFSFTAPELNLVNKSALEFEPFFRIHDARYMIYWMWLSPAQYGSYLDSLAVAEKLKTDLHNRTVDFVAPGEQQPEADHQMEKMRSTSGTFHDEFWRDARNEGYFSYNMATASETGLSLMVRYWGAEWGNRKFDIFIDDEKLVTEDNTGRWNQSRFQELLYDIPDAMVKDKTHIRVKFQALPGSTAGAIYYLRLVRKQ